MIKEFIKKTIEQKNLSFFEAYSAMKEIMEGKATNAQIAALITALRIKNETPDEIAGFAKAMQEKAIHPNVNGKNFIDTCGTGGDNKHTFNISTAAAFISAGAGVKIAKHGNKSISSKSGSADVLKACGVNIEAKIEIIEKALNEINIGFLYAPMMHKAMKYAAPVRKELEIKTIFNILGPLTNPCGTKKQIIGVFSENLVETIANVLKRLELEEAYVVYGKPGLDEISISDKTKIAHLYKGKIEIFEISPEDYGIKKEPIEKIKGGTPEENAKIMKDLLKGNLKNSPIENICVLNSAFCIKLAGIATSIEEAIKKAKESIYSGKAFEKLQLLAKISNQ